MVTQIPELCPPQEGNRHKQKQLEMTFGGISVKLPLLCAPASQ